MRVTYDEATTVAYIYLVDDEIPAGGVAKTIRATPEINLDFDHAGHLVGIEVLEAGMIVPAVLAWWRVP